MSGSLQLGSIVGDLGINSLDFDQPEAVDENGVEVDEVDDIEGAKSGGDHVASRSVQARECEPSAQGDRDDACSLGNEGMLAVEKV